MSAPVSQIREPLITGHKTYHQITEDLISPTEKTPSFAWTVGFIISAIFLGLYVFSVLWTIYMGIGTWNLNRTVGWGWDITNFVWWVGIGHPFDLQTKMENRGQQSCRSDDHFCGHLCRTVSFDPHG